MADICEKRKREDPTKHAFAYRGVLFGADDVVA